MAPIEQEWPVANYLMQDMAVKAAVVGYTEKYLSKAGDDTSEEVPAAEPEFSMDKLDELENVDLIGLVMSGESTDDTETDEEDSLRECTIGPVCVCGITIFMMTSTLNSCLSP